MNADHAAPATAASSDLSAAAQLHRVLGHWDLVFLFVVAVVNLNVLPAVAGNGPFTVWLWLLALVFFFWPQGIAVIELSQRYPGEGGVYLWSKKIFGDFHGFLSGWCYWTNNIFYVPTVLLYLVGISLYIAGPRFKLLADNSWFTFGASIVLLAFLVWLNITGLGVSKWIHNLGGIGTSMTAIALVGLAIAVWRSQGTSLTAHDFRIPADFRAVSSFGIICFGLVGLELASVMGDEIRDPRRVLPGAVAWGGVISGILYIGATVALLLAVPKNEIGVLQGIVEAVSRMAAHVGLAWVVIPFTLVLSVSIAGIASAWLSGSARIPFVAGLDAYMPRSLGKLHPVYRTPYIALVVQSLLSGAFLAMSLIGAQVKEAFVTMLDLAVVLQLVPFLYMYAALIRLSRRGSLHEKDDQGYFSRKALRIAGISGLVTTILGMIVAFVPSRQIASIWIFEVKMCAGTLFFLGLAAFFFFGYGNRKLSQAG